VRIFSFSGLRIVRLRPRWPLPAGANRLVHGRLRRFHPSAQPRACGCPRSASFSGPDALRMRPEQCSENISGNMSEDMSGNLSGVLPERASRRSSGWLRKEARTALREVLQTTLWETRRRRSGKSCKRRSGKSCKRRSGKPCKRRPGKSCNGVPRAPRSPAPGAPDPPQPSRATAGARFIRLRENIFLLFE
jgi:hypothetical protein